MTNIKSLVAGGLLLAVAGAAMADPSMKLMPAGAKAGSAAAVVVKGILGGATSLVGAEIHVKFDAKATVENVSATATAGSGWVTGAFNVVNGNEAIWIGANGDGQTADGTIVTISVGVVGTTKLTLTTDSNVTDQDYNPWNPPANQEAALVNGAIRDLGGAIAGAPSTGPGGVVAVAAGTALKLVKASDLTDVAGFAAPAVGPVSGRPAFGMIGAQAVIAVGDDEGKLTVVDAATGAPVAALALGAKVSTPAIAPDGTIYVAVSGAGPATLVKVVGGAPAPVATLTGTTVLGAPAVFGGLVSVGTDKGVEVIRAADGIPQAGVADAAGATIAPIIGAGGKAVSANAASILGFNALTGAPTAATVHSGGALSEAWYDAATDKVSFGAAGGKVLSVALAGGTPELSAALTPAAIAAQPIVLNGTTYVIDAAGNIAADNVALSAPLGGPGAKALAATGRTSGTDSIIAATNAGIVASIAL